MFTNGSNNKTWLRRCLLLSITVLPLIMLLVMTQLVFATTAPSAGTVTKSCGSTALTTKFNITLSTGSSIKILVTPTLSITPPSVGDSPGSAAAYTDGSDIAGTDASTNKYVNVYAIGGGVIQGFSQVTILATDIAAPTLDTPPSTAVGTVAASAQLNVTPNTSGNTFKIKVRSSALLTLPAVGVDPPSDASVFVSTNNVTSVDATTYKYVDIYEIKSSKVVAFKEITLLSASIAAPTLTSATAFAGASASTSQLVLTPNVPGDTYKVKVANTALTVLPAVGSTAPTDSVQYTTGTSIATSTANKYVQVYEVNGTTVVGFKEITLTNSQITAPDFTSAPVPILGTVGSSTKLTVIANTTGDLFKVRVASSTTSLPVIGGTTPGDVIAYKSGENITGLDITTNRFIDLYEVDKKSNAIVAYRKITPTTAQMTVPALTSPTAIFGSTASSTVLTSIPTTTSGSTIQVKVSSAVVPFPALTGTVTSGAITYTTGNPITGLNPTTTKYIAVYEMSGSTINAFKVIQIPASAIAAPDFTTTPTHVKGTTSSSVKLVVTPNTKGNIIKVKVNTLVTTRPATSADVPSAAAAFVSGGNVLGVDATTNKYIDIYEVDKKTTKVVAFKSLLLSVSNIVCPGIPDITPSPGLSSGSTKLSITPTTTVGAFFVTVSSIKITTLPAIGDSTPVLGSAYTTGSDITGVSSTNKYIRIYEHQSNTVLAFREFLLAPSQITALDFTSAPALSLGTVASAVKIRVTANTSGNLFKVKVVPAQTTKPVIGGTLPTGTTAYTSNTNIIGVDKTTNKYIDIFEVDKKLLTIVSFRSVTPSVAQISAPTLTVSPSAIAGIYASSTAIFITPNNVGDTYKYKVSSSPVTFPSIGGDFTSGTAAYTTGTPIVGVDPVVNKYVNIYVYDATTTFSAFRVITLTAGSISAPIITSPATVAIGTTSSSIKLSLRANTSGNFFKVGITTTSGAAIPVTASTVTSSAITFISGNNVVFTTPFVTNYVDIYEVDKKTTKLAAYRQLVVSPTSISAPLVPTVVVSAGALSGSTNLTVTPVINDANTLYYYKVTSSSAITTLPAICSAVPTIGFTSTTSRVITVAGVNSTVNKYIDLYEAFDSTTDLVYSFRKITLLPGQITAPAFTSPPVLTLGTVPGSTKIAIVPNTSGNILKVKVVDSTTSKPVIGAAVPTTGASIYVSGNNITNLTTSKFIDIYEVDKKFFTVIAFQEVTASAVQVATPSITVSPVAIAGTSPASTSLIITPNTVGDSYKVLVSSVTATVPAVQGVVPTEAVAYTTGSNIIGVDPVTNKYVNLFELSGANLIAFRTITLTAGSITAPTLTTPPQVAIGTTASSVKLTLTANTKGNIFKIKVVTTTTTLPVTGGDVPTSAALFISGANVVGVDATTNKYVDIYELNKKTNKIAAFKEITLLTTQVAAPTIAAISASAGTTSGSTKITYTPNITGDTYAYKVSNSATMTTMPVVGGTLPDGTTAYTTVTSITGVNASTNKYLDVYEVGSTTGSGIVAFKKITLTGSQIIAPAFTTPPVLALGTVNSSTKITVLPNTVGNLLKVKVVTVATSLSVIGADLPSETIPYTSGTNVLNVTTSKFIDIYEVDKKTLKIASFQEVTATSAAVALPVITVSPSAIGGTTSGSTSLTIAPNNVGDTFKVLVTSTRGATVPAVSGSAPTEAVSYTTCSNLSGVDPVTNKYVNIYEYTGANLIAFKTITLTAGAIKAPTLTVTPTVITGTTYSSVKITVSPNTTGNTFKIKVVSSTTTPPVTGGDLPEGTSTFVSGNNITGVDSTTYKYVDIYEINKKTTKIAAFREVLLTSTQIAAPMIASVTASAGTSPASVKLAITPNTAGDTFKYIISSTATSTMSVVGGALPDETTSYTTGSDITGVNATTKKYVDLYEVNGSSLVVAFKKVILAAGQITAPEFTNGITADISTLYSSTKLNVAANSKGNVLKILKGTSLITTLPVLGATLPDGTSTYVMNTPIGSVDSTTNKYIAVYEVTKTGAIATFQQVTLGDDEVTCPTFSTSPVAIVGAAQGNTKITITTESGVSSYKIDVRSAKIVLLPAYKESITTGSSFTSGSDLTGVSLSAKYVDIYGLNGSGKCIAFAELVLTGDQIKAPALGTPPTVTFGTVQEATQITLVPNATGDKFMVKYSDTSAPTAPAIGSTPESGAAAYVSKANLTGVSTTYQYIRIFEINKSSKVVAFVEKTLSATDISALAIATTPPTITCGSVSGSTQITITPNVAGNTLRAKVSSTTLAYPAGGGSAPDGAGTYTSGTDLAGVSGTNKYVGIYEMNSSDKVVAFKLITLAKGQYK